MKKLQEVKHRYNKIGNIGRGNSYFKCLSEENVLENEYFTNLLII